jgi:hypothetical protein
MSKLGYDGFLQNPFQFIINYSLPIILPTIQRYIVCDNESVMK